MAKLTMSHAIFVEVEVEVPEKCPGCSASFTEGDALRELDWSETKYLGRLADGEFETIDYEQGDANVSAGWWCGECGEEIATAGTSYATPGLPLIEEAIRVSNVCTIAARKET